MRTLPASDFDSGLPDDLVGPGMVTDGAARIWLRTARPGPHELVVEGPTGPTGHVHFEIDAAPERDGTATVLYGWPATDAALEPNTQYRFTIGRSRDDQALGTGSFVTAPRAHADTPEVYRFALASCNMPFDDHGCMSGEANTLVDAADALLEEHHVARMLFVGDQMYSDMPASRSLFDDGHFATVAPPGRASIFECTREEVRALYQRRHRIFWKNASVRELMARRSCSFILDDHEIVDNFGSAAEHASPKWRNIRAGALDAFYDYQGQRALERPPEAERPASFHHTWRFGTSAVFVADLRSQKVATADRIAIYGESQHAALEAFLADNRARHVVFIALSVPILHVPDWMATFAGRIGAETGDAADRWSHDLAVASRDRLLGTLRTHQCANPHQRIVLLGGDIHVGLATCFRFPDTPRPIYQLASSALSNVNHPLLQMVADTVPLLRSEVMHGSGMTELLPGVDVRGINPCGKLNLGIVEVERRSSDQSTVRLLLYGADTATGEVDLAFDSGRL